jgi:predicted site-specific integrase-resolvase
MSDTGWIDRIVAAKMADVSPRTIKRWMDAGHVRYTRDPRTGRISIDRASVQAHLKKRAAP